MADLSWFDLGTLNGLDEEIEAIMTSSTEVDELRRSAIVKAVSQRILQIDRIGH